VVVLIDVGMTLAWKEPLSTVYGSIQQGKAADSLHELEQSFFDLPQARAAANENDARERIDQLADAFADEVETGQGIGRIEIDAIGLDTVVVQGTDTASLQKGPGHYPETAFPGQGSTIGIAGHRTTYLAPFRRINEIEKGDEVVLEMPYGTFTYEVEGDQVVDPYQVEIVDDVGYERLVLTACHPLYSAAQRWAVFARLSDAEPVE
jgi:sortase A